MDTVPDLPRSGDGDKHHDAASSRYSNLVFLRGRQTLLTGTPTEYTGSSSGAKPVPALRATASLGTLDIGKPVRVVTHAGAAELHDLEVALTSFPTTVGTGLSGELPPKPPSDASADSVMELRLQELAAKAQCIEADLALLALDRTNGLIMLLDTLGGFVPPPRVLDTLLAGLVAHARAVVKVVLSLVDNWLREPAYLHLRTLVLRAHGDFLRRTGLAEPGAADQLWQNSTPQPAMFAIGAAEFPHPELDMLSSIVERLTLLESGSGRDAKGTPFKVVDQEGSFIAPVLRGILSKRLAVLTIVVGFPQPESKHYDMLPRLQELHPQIHFTIQKNYITECSGRSARTAPPAPEPAYFNTLQRPAGRMLPFRIPANPLEPPMLMLILAATDATKLGTLGGYIFPKTGPAAVELHEFNMDARLVYALTCGHVLLGDVARALRLGSSVHRMRGRLDVAVPLALLVNLYRLKFVEERSKYDDASPQHRFYSEQIAYLDTAFPEETIDSGLDKERARFGEVKWGERCVVLSMNKVLDMAVVQVNPALRCVNTLGDDIPFVSFDTLLMFQNLLVKLVLRRKDFNANPGMQVFKYGSTTGYTKGRMNGLRMAYWKDGLYRTSEFVVLLVVNGDDGDKSLPPGVRASANNGVFASGGDLGAWILSKLWQLDAKDVPEHVVEQRRRGGLGVCGMLHLIDGEFKQFGLFLPMEDVLLRLHDITNVPWGVVGADEEDEGDSDVYESPDSSDSEGSVASYGFA